MKNSIIRPKIINEKILYKNNFLAIREADIEFRKKEPNGELKTLEDKYYFIDSKDYVVILIKDNDGKILLTNQYRPAIGTFSNEFVAGYIDNDEKPIDAAKREMKEETGCESKDLVNIGNIYPIVGKGKATGYVFVCEEFVQGESKQEEKEKFVSLKSEWVDSKKIFPMIRDGKIKDSTTLAAWSLYLSHIVGE